MKNCDHCNESVSMKETPLGREYCPKCEKIQKRDKGMPEPHP